MKKNSLWFLCFLVTISLTGCATLHRDGTALLKKRDKTYLKSESRSTLKIPAGLSASKIGGDFTIPPSTSTAAIPASTVSPYGSVSAQLPVEKVLVRDDPAGYPGVIVRHPPAKAYQVLKAALAKSKDFSVVKSSAKLHWLTVKSTELKANYELYLLRYGRDTRVYITDAQNNKLMPSQAEKVAANLATALTATKAYHKSVENQQYFLKPFFTF